VERRYIPFEVGREEIYPTDDRGKEIYPSEAREEISQKEIGEDIYPSGNRGEEMYSNEER
jgi:hypothetical protein